MAAKPGLGAEWNDIWRVDGVRTPFADARELQRSGGRYGIVSACIGGGQGIAVLLENPNAKAA